jgi:DNA-binding MarR family transcriptional regulator
MGTIISKLEAKLNKKFLAELTISYHDYLMLTKLAALTLRSPQVKQEDLKQVLSVDKSTVSRRLRVCEQAGYINRLINAKSEREKLVRLTSKGKSVVEAGDALAKSEISNLMQKLNKYDLKQFQINLLSILAAIN